jgi:integrase
MRHRNDGLRKICGCRRTNWPKCQHAWHFYFYHRGRNYRCSLDREVGRQITSKAEAEAAADRMRTSIRNGGVPTKQITAAPAPTLQQLGEIYFEKHRSPNGDPLLTSERHRWNLLIRTTIRRPNGGETRIGDIPVDALTRHDIEAFREVHRRVRTEKLTDRTGREKVVHRGGPVGVNRCLLRLRAFYNWAIANEHVATTPFKRGSVSVIRMFKEAERERRLEPGEEERLFKACGPHLRALVTAALETCCRVSELLKLQWKHVRFDLNEIRLPAANTKARRPRILPISTGLRALLEMRRHDAAGREHGRDAFVLGNLVGEPVASVDTAWRAACRRAGIVGLHFHDLRREGGSRLLEGGVPEHYVQRFLDHANLSTTSRRPRRGT